MKASLRRQAALLTCANAITRGMGFCLHLLLARLMSAEALGVMEMAGSVSMLALTPVTAGIPTAMSRMTARRPGVDRENVLRAGLHHVRRLSLVLSPLLVALSPLLSWLLGDQRTLPAIAVNAPAMALLGACGVYSGYCIGLGQARLPAACECAEQAVRLGLSVGLVALMGRIGRGDIAVTAALPGLSLTFSEDGRTWCENDNGQATVTAYAITAVADAQVAESAGTVTTTTDFTVQTPAGTSMATLTTQSYSDGSASVTTLKCSAFKSSPSWTLAERARSLVVEGPDDEWFTTYGTTPEALSRAFDDFVGTAWPTVSRATWDGTMGFDYAAGVARLPFTLDDARRTKVSAVLTLSNGSFAVGMS